MAEANEQDSGRTQEQSPSRSKSLSEVKTRKVVVKKKTKNWYKLLAPEIFNFQEIGTTIAEVPESLVGRTISISLGTLLNDVTKHGINLKLQAVSTEKHSAHTKIVQFELTRPYLSRFLRKNTSFVYSNDYVKTKDEISVKVKTIIITSFKSKGKQKSDLRKAIKELIAKQVANYNYEAFITAASANKLQAEMQSVLRTIYPIKSVVIQKIELKGIAK